MIQSREALLKTVLMLVDFGLMRGSAGNVSVRVEDGLLITPSGAAAEEMSAEGMVQLDLHGSVKGGGKPSSEWRFHRDIYQARPEVTTVVHTHSMFATTIACLRKDIPPFHYMISLAGGNTIRCAPYALFGTQALSDNAVQALVGRNACLLANHGLIAVGRDLDHALKVTIEVETLCEQYWRALQIGEPELLSDAEMQAVHEQFKGYVAWSK
jgi:L-fuculose-phosphate aldolase